MRIHGLVYILVGGFLAGFSYYITTMNADLDLDKFMIFIYIGALFAIIGLVKLVAGAMSKPRIAKENFQHNIPQQQATHHQHPHAHNQPHPNGTGQHHHHAQHAHQVSHQSAQAQKDNSHVKFCSNCGSPLRSFDKFCYKCGGKRFKR